MTFICLSVCLSVSFLLHFLLVDQLMAAQDTRYRTVYFVPFKFAIHVLLLLNPSLRLHLDGEGLCTTQFLPRFRVFNIKRCTVHRNYMKIVLRRALWLRTKGVEFQLYTWI